MRLAEVVIDIPTKSLDGSYTYALPEDLLDEAEVGCAVQVQFGGRGAVGFIVEVREGEAFEGLKPVKAVLSGSYFDESGAECARFLSRRYLAPLSVCVRCFTPPGAVPRMVKGPHGGWQLQRPRIDAVDDRWVTKGPNIDGFTPRRNATKQAAVISAVRQGDVKLSELNALYGNVSSTVASLEKAGAVAVESRRRMRVASNGGGGGEGEGSRYFVDSLPREDLTQGQARAIDEVSSAYEAKDGQVVLIDGVTGSGKTEVYLQAIARSLADGRSSIVLVPEISLTPQTVARFRGRFGDTVAVLHSRMSPGERFDQWDLIRNGRARVVVGARSALFAPLQDLGLIVIDEEHESTYKQESAPRYVSRDVAAWMMKTRRGTLVLGSATPSLEALYKSRHQEGWHVVKMPERANGRPLPEVEIVDMALEFRSGGREMFSHRLRRAMVEELSEGRKVVLLLNQRGFAQFLLCRDCGFVPKCDSCSTTLTYHSKGNRLVCHHCGKSVPAPAKCPECESPYLKKFGAGTQRVEDELRALLDAEFAEMPEITGPAGPVPVIRMDADTTSTKGSHRRLLEQFAEAPRAVLLGTQMIAKGLDFDDVTLVGVVNADTQLHLPDFRSAERTFDLIEQVAGRAGRADLPGRVMVQTYEADNVAIRAAAAYDREMFLRAELPKRRVLGYPPYVRMANIVVWGRNEDAVKEECRRFHAEVVERLLQFALTGWVALDATPCVFERLKGDYRWHVVVKCPLGKDISRFLGDVYKSVRPEPGVNVAIDIDPIDLL